MYIYVSALQQTLTVSFSRESFLLVSTPVEHSRDGSSFVSGSRKDWKVTTAPARRERSCALNNPRRGTDGKLFRALCLPLVVVAEQV